MANSLSNCLSKFILKRRGRKLCLPDDQRTIAALPKDISERTWSEILQKEEIDLFIFDLREEILEGAIAIYYNKYMEKQNAIFTAHCAALAWMKLINWHFYRHDPGEDVSAYPPCFIPKRQESWIPDEIPKPSPKDTWLQQDLNVVEELYDEGSSKVSSDKSLEFPVVEEIPSEYWFPGKINVPEELRRKPKVDKAYSYESSSSAESPSDENVCTESEVLQKVTEYSTAELSKSSTGSPLRSTSRIEEHGSLKGAGDSVTDATRREKSMIPKKRISKTVIKSKSSVRSRMLPPLDTGDSGSRISIVSDCRLRNFRLETQCEISSQKVNTPPGEIVKRK